MAQHENTKLNVGVSCCYVINLRDKPGRWKRMQEELSRIDVSVERIDAVNGKEELKDQEPPFSRETFRRLTPGEYGCLKSHELVWRKIAAGADDFCLVLEDDVLLSPRFNEFLRKFKANPNEVDIVHMEKTGKGTSFLSSSSSTVFEVNGIKVARVISSLVYTGAMIISCTGAMKLLECAKGIWMPADELLFSKRSPLFGKLNIYQTQTVLAWQITDKGLNQTLSEEYSSSIHAEKRQNKKSEPKIYKPLRAIRKLVKGTQYVIATNRTKDKVQIPLDESDIELVKNRIEKKV